MRILVTGSKGFIGSHLVPALLYLDHEVIEIDSLEPQVHGVNLELATNPRNASEFDTKIPYDAVIHLAAVVGVGQSQYEPFRYTQKNVMDTVRMLGKLMTLEYKPKALIVASSMSLYGEGAYDRCGMAPVSRQVEQGWDCFTDGEISYRKMNPRLTPEIKTPNPTSVYALNKWHQEQYSLLLGGLMGIRTVALRFFNVYGPGQSTTNPYTGVLSNFAYAARHDFPLRVFEDGYQTRDFIHVSDIVSGIITTLHHGHAQGIYNVCTSRFTMLIRLAAMMSDNLMILNEYRKGDVRHCIGDNSKLRGLGWLPKVQIDPEQVAALVDSVPLEKEPVDRMGKAYLELKEKGLMTPGPLSPAPVGE